MLREEGVGSLYKGRSWMALAICDPQIDDCYPKHLQRSKGKRIYVKEEIRADS